MPKSTRSPRRGSPVLKRTVKAWGETPVCIETPQHKTTVTGNSVDEPVSDLKDEEIYWPGPETAEQIIADIYSRR